VAHKRALERITYPRPEAHGDWQKGHTSQIRSDGSFIPRLACQARIGSSVVSRLLHRPAPPAATRIADSSFAPIVRLYRARRGNQAAADESRTQRRHQGCRGAQPRVEGRAPLKNRTRSSSHGQPAILASEVSSKGRHGGVVQWRASTWHNIVMPAYRWPTQPGRIARVLLV